MTESEFSRQSKELSDAMNSISPFNPKWADELNSTIQKIAQELWSKHPKPTDDDIISCAKELSKNANKIKRDIYEEYEDKCQQQNEVKTRRPTGFFLFDIFGATTTETTITTSTVPCSKTRKKTIEEQPSYESFMVVCKEKLQPPLMEYFINEAKKIKSAEIKKNLLLKKKQKKDL